MTDQEKRDPAVDPVAMNGIDKEAPLEESGSTNESGDVKAPVSGNGKAPVSGNVKASASGDVNAPASNDMNPSAAPEASGETGIRQQPRISEIEDSFTTFAGKKGSLEKNDPAYHIQGTKEPVNVLHDIKVSIPMNEIKAVAKEHGCTVTDILTASIVYALQKMHIEDPRPRKANVLKVNVPVDLRRVFGGRTLRNYSSYVNLGVDVTNGYRTFDEILKEVSLQKNLYTLPSNLEPKIAANVGLERNVGVRCIPRFIKKPVIDIINKLHGDRFCSQTLSNIGNVKLPAEMQPYVREMDFILGRQRGNAGAAAAIGYGDTLNVNFSRGIVEDDFENYFREQLLALGIRSDDKFIEVASACTPTSFRCEASPVWK